MLLSLLYDIPTRYVFTDLLLSNAFPRLNSIKSPKRLIGHSITLIALYL